MIVKKGKKRAKKAVAGVKRPRPVRAEKNGASGEADGPLTHSSVTISANGSSTTLIPLAARDWPISIIALELLEKAIKAARKALAAVALDPDLVARRDAECSALLEGLRSESPALKLGVNVDWLPTLKAGLSLEFDQTRKLADTQEELRLDPEETENRIKQLERLLAELDVAGMAGSGG